MSEICEHCGARMSRYWHKLTPGLITTLVKVYTAVVENQINLVHKSELDLDHSEYGNFQKLRFHALIAKHRVDGKWISGTWVITKRGADFLKGIIKVPDRVKTYRNKVEAHSDRLVNVAEVMRSNPYWEEHSDFVNQETTLAFLDHSDKEEPIKVVKSVKKKKGKQYCPVCEDQLKIEFSFIQGKESVIVKKYLACPSCNFRKDAI